MYKAENEKQKLGLNGDGSDYLVSSEKRKEKRGRGGGGCETQAVIKITKVRCGPGSLVAEVATIYLFFSWGIVWRPAKNYSIIGLEYFLAVGPPAGK